MLVLEASSLQEISSRLFNAAGSPREESEWVSEVLVRASLMGHDSHGVQRIPQYVADIRIGRIRPGAPFEILRETCAIAVVHGHHGWGPVIARKAMLLAIEKARQCGVGTVSVRGCQHIGRAGEYPALAAAEQMIGLAFVNSYGGGGTVAPFGGIDGRFAPNPLAFAAPSGHPWPVLVDITASVVPEGKVRLARYQGKPLPPGCIVDANGNPTTDPAAFYGPPPGALLPLGGIVGHKGTGLAVIDELLAGALSGAGCSGRRQELSGNGLFFQAINIADFLPVDEFITSVQELITWTKSSRRKPGVEEILFPGEPEFRSAERRSREGIPVDEAIWAGIVNAAQSLGVHV